MKLQFSVRPFQIPTQENCRSVTSVDSSASSTTTTDAKTTEVTLNTTLEAIHAWESSAKAAFKRANDAVDETVKNIDETVKTIAKSRGFRYTKSKVDETVQSTMAKVSQCGADHFFDAAAEAAIEEDDAAHPEDESSNDIAEDAMSVLTEDRRPGPHEEFDCTR